MEKFNLKQGIKTPSELREAIEIAKLKDDNYDDAIWAIYKYKWYNWYQNIHIKQGSPQDEENTEIFNMLNEDYIEIHNAVEGWISYEIEKLSNDIE
jgi:hypothetical protein